MKRFKVTLLAFFLLAMAATTANASLTFYDNQATFNSVVTTNLIDDYDTGSPRNVTLSSLTRNGVTYSPLAGVPFPNVYLADAGYSNFGAGVGTTTSGVLTTNGDENFLASFATGVGAVSFDTLRNGLGPTTVSVYSGAILLGTYTPAGNPDDIGFLGFISTNQLITAFEWNSTLGGQINTGIDNLRTAPIAAPVPEPETYAMLLAGLGLLGAFSRRRRLQATR